ncbi:uncharacterized protein BYT42DRAFT_601210 [Radiomyces spectabilis]|uniref:uncharacterized protein n=1 Tax=Radiomyces spectabilis TaxID=64574 RepID=UPI00222117E2|nr:uncharacterized protein BYT42DRAFT_601210 [Radiomyces spectabilis]KAI8393572.1 hypothetical protein BYT42DRAFT_601210 [Radiomyces spectabilis]
MPSQLDDMSAPKSAGSALDLLSTRLPSQMTLDDPSRRITPNAPLRSAPPTANTAHSLFRYPPNDEDHAVPDTASDHHHPHARPPLSTASKSHSVNSSPSIVQHATTNASPSPPQPVRTRLHNKVKKNLCSPVSPRNASSSLSNDTKVNGGTKVNPVHKLAKKVSETLSPVHTNPHGHASSGAMNKAIKNATCVTVEELGRMLQHASTAPLLIDMRDLAEFEKARISHSINVNLPSLLIKRYRRGTISHFNLESFITTPEGVDYYLRWMDQHGSQTSVQKVMVYDHAMSEQDTSSDAWTLIGVLDKSFSDTKQNLRVCWLQDGFKKFQEWPHADELMVGTLYHRLDTPFQNLSDTHSPDWMESDLTKTPAPVRSLSRGTQLSMPTPMLSRSATTASIPSIKTGTNVQRRASLFTLDTSNVRKNKYFSGSQRRNDVKSKLGTVKPDKAGLLSIPEGTDRTQGSSNSSLPSPHPLAKTHDVPATPIDPPSSHIPSTPMPEEVTPATENEYAFIISEIVPGFLYLGPEIATTDQLKALKLRSIRRILNMAEECDDDVPGLKEAFKYTKVSARDTVEMRNVYETLHTAVRVIEDAKGAHEPIYVHCKAGKSRSVAVILAYLILVEKWTLKRAYRHIIKSRPNASPNIGFVVELMKLEESVHGQVSNFAGSDWHIIDLSNPPSPDSQREIRKLQTAWKKGSSSTATTSSSPKTSPWLRPQTEKKSSDALPDS